MSFIGRRDLSSRFGADKRVAYFSSILAGWVVSEEAFFKENNTINFLKVRASYGRLGNDAIGDFRFRSLLNGEATYVFDNQLINGTAPGVISNQQVQWEADKKFDLGIDMKLLKSKVDFTADYFVDSRSELLIIGVPVSGTLGGTAPGSGAPTINAGTVENKGFEIAVNYKSDATKSFNYSLGFNVTTLDNEVTEVRNSKKYVESGAFGVGNNLAPTRMQEGYAIGSFFGYVTDGIFQNQAQVAAHPSRRRAGQRQAGCDRRPSAAVGP